MAHTVARFEKRRKRWRSEAHRTTAAAFAVIGLGWLIVVPAVLGFALGHWLDARYGSGVALAAGLGLLGLTFGCWSAWQRIREQRKDHEGRG
jgi:ATP synthase protein I